MHTNHTSNYELSQFISTDKPTFLGDYNGDMQKIDTAIAGVGVTATGADTKADSAITAANSAASTAATAAQTAADGAVTALKTSLKQTLTAGQTSVTFTNAAITTTARADLYVKDATTGAALLLYPTAVSESTGSITFTFDAQLSDIEVALWIVEEATN